jgi:hypothetical protein
MKVERVAQLEPGELFLFELLDNVKYVGLMCDYRDPDQKKLTLPLGPRFPQRSKALKLVDLPVTGISFGKDFAIRLPVNPQDWSRDEPPDDHPCLLVTETTVLFRANGHIQDGMFRACFVDVATGVVAVAPGPPPDYARPSGMLAFTTSWEIVTTEPEPRLILKFPLPT